MKQLITALGILVLSGSAYGQAISEKRLSKMEKMKSELNLSQDQMKQMEERRVEYDLILADEALSKEEKKERLIKMKVGQKEILDEAQKQKMKEIKAEKSAERMMKNHERKAFKSKVKTYRAEFDSKITEEDKATLAKIKKTMELRRAEGAVREKGENREELKMLRSLGLKYDTQVKEFLQAKGVPSNQEVGQKKVKKKRQAKVGQGKKEETMRGRGNRKNRRVVRFLLMDF